MSIAESSPTSVPVPDAQAPRLVWQHPPEGFLALSLLNGVLRILTLGVYHFWGKTEVRQRIWSAVRIDGEPLEYRGTGGELFRGFLIVFFLVLVPLGVVSFLIPLFVGIRSPLRGLYEIGFWGLLFLLSGVGIHRARRYRLSRTRWRAIRGGVSGASAPFALTYLWTFFLIPLTLGWILPWRAVVLHKALFNQTCFGDKTFSFTGRAGPLYRRFWLVWLSAVVLVVGAFSLIGAVFAADIQRAMLMLPPVFTSAKIAAVIGIVFVSLLIFAIIRAWYSTRMLNYFASQTTFQGTGFTLHATVGSLVWLAASNYLIRILSLGILSPIAEARSMRYIVDRMSIDQPVAWQAVQQNPDALLQRGEGLAEAFNVDAF